MTGRDLPSKMARRRARKGTALSVFGMVLLVLVIVTFLPFSVPRLLGYTLYDVTSGSMEPEIPVGSVVYVAPVSAFDLEPGDIVAYTRVSSGGQSATVVHRVVSNDSLARELVTQGDANDSTDPLPVEYSEVVGKVEFHLPWLGALAAAYTTTPGKVVALAVAVLGLVMSVAGARMRDA